MSVRLAVIRHGPTEWNADRRLQGHTDIPLSPEGRAQVSAYRLPPDLNGLVWLASPLGRTRETAELLGVTEPRVEPRLLEMNWGDWEGRTVADLRAELGEEMRRNEDKGLDFLPPGGESPRQVQERLAPLLREIGSGGTDTGAVTHKGVIRALYAQAKGWPMLGKPPDRLDWRSAHLFRVDARGGIKVDRLNLPLTKDGPA